METMELFGVPLEAGALFSIANNVALVGWAMLIFLPRRYDLIFMFPQYLIPFSISVLYAALIMTNFFTVEGGFGSIGEVRSLFQNDYVLVAGWAHYLAFDLFIGAWIARQADRLGIPRLIQAVLLLATFMFGPMGLALFLIMRTGYGKRMERAGV